ncbi:ParA family protein [Staphylococcus capitis]|uniref:ParA family protein n=1 Tax=Staphylococcus capitis TaxID=29388 RepID=UPI0028793DA6|nr:ParA family protein [Staphylococcus capitis]MDS4002568.1 ParA family protein [Staphylococcus capitis]
MLPKIITINQQKGGTGKSTLTKNLTTHLAIERNKKVLNIDGDYSCFLSTNLYGIYDPNGTIGELFQIDELGNTTFDRSIVFHHVHDNIDIIAGDPKLNEKQKRLSGEEGTSFILTKWLFNNKKELSSYDYIIIDTHNDFDIFNKNAIAISDVVLAPLDPSEINESIATRMEVELEKMKNQIVEPISGKSYVNAKFYIIGNKISHNVSSHREFLNDIKKRDDFLTWFPQKELFVKASKKIKSINELLEKDKNKHQRFVKQYAEAMKKIENVIDGNQDWEEK